MNVLEDLMYRGLLHQVTDLDGLAERLAKGPITLYNGFDPTADSLTIGNLVPLLMLRRFQLAGHHPICLVGGGTGLIGDPGGKDQERALNPSEVVEAFTGKIRAQVEPFLDFEVKTNPARLVNNLDWLSGVTAIELMRDVGKHFPVPYMLAKESVASRLKTGISYTEFSYMVLQAYDFLELHRRLGCQLQTGGSDQWGNITAGSDLIRRADGAKAFGLTCPLVTSADGAKFGKTEAGALWLSPERTSPYEFYQYWINTDDRTVGSYLRIFTFLEPRRDRPTRGVGGRRPRRPGGAAHPGPRGHGRRPRTAKPRARRNGSRGPCSRARCGSCARRTWSWPSTECPPTPWRARSRAWWSCSRRPGSPAPGGRPARTSAPAPSGSTASAAPRSPAAWAGPTVSTAAAW